MINNEFEDLRPYYDNEINPAMNRIVNNPLFEIVASSLYPDTSFDQLKKIFLSFQTVNEFQVQVMHHAVKQIVKSSIENFTYDGVQQIEKNKNYLFISNHRDIITDSALFELVLHLNKLKTTEISFGSNLMQSDFVVDIGKSNKMFKVERDGNARELVHHARHLSNYIRYALQQKNESVWIAQRSGRAKDGNDLTEQGILKMFCLSSNKPILENLAELNIVPVSVSYQWETCDVLKVKELYKSRSEKYIKAPGEDLNSMITGVKQFKGNVHYEFAPPITKEDLNQFKNLEKNKLFDSVAKLIDERIHRHYKLWNNNYIAFDLLNHQSSYLDNQYSAGMRDFFISKMEQKLAQCQGDLEELKTIYLRIYANPIINAFS